MTANKSKGVGSFRFVSFSSAEGTIYHFPFEVIPLLKPNVYMGIVCTGPNPSFSL